MPTNFSLSDLPAKYAAKVREIALKKGMSEEEVVVALMSTFFDLVDVDGEDEASLIRRWRAAMSEKFGIGSD
jgi:hypothetical protein